MMEKSFLIRSSNSFSVGLPLSMAPDEAIEVGAGREVATGAGEDGDPDVGVAVDQVPGIAQPAQHLGVEGVALGGTVQRHGDDVTVTLDEDGGFGRFDWFAHGGRA